MKRLLNPRVFALLLLLVIAAIWLVNVWVERSTRAQLYDDVLLIPHRKLGLVLGTSKLLGDGSQNLYYKYRIDAAIALYQAGKVEYILVSGDNGSEHYDETSAMKDDLVTAGIPADRIYCDFAGFRTLDSILRCKKVFGETAVTVISQPFHNERAVFIANYKGLDAVAFNARDVKKYYGMKVMAREKLARVKMLLDLAVNKRPKFYGPPVKIG